MRFKQTIYESTQAPLARSSFPMRVMPKSSLQVTNHQSLAANHQKRNRFRDSFFYFLSPP